MAPKRVFIAGGAMVASPWFFLSGRARAMRAADADSERIGQRLAERERVSAEEVAERRHEGVEVSEVRA